MRHTCCEQRLSYHVSVFHFVLDRTHDATMPSQVRSFIVTWWPDLWWPGVKIERQIAPGVGGEIGPSNLAVYMPLGLTKAWDVIIPLHHHHHHQCETHKLQQSNFLLPSHFALAWQGERAGERGLRRALPCLWYLTAVVAASIIIKLSPRQLQRQVWCLISSRGYLLVAQIWQRELFLTTEKQTECLDVSERLNVPVFMYLLAGELSCLCAKWLANINS